MPGVFITGTDTGVGKTLVAAGLLHSLREAGLDAVPMKPVQTGSDTENGRLISPDLRFCLELCGIEATPDEESLMAPYRFATPCSPHLAARIENRSIDALGIRDCFEELARRRDAVIVEGAGGVLTPISDSKTMLDVMQTLSIPVLLVARRGLGTINHTLLSLRALREAGVEVFGVIFNQLRQDEPAFIGRDNVEMIGRLGDAPVLGSLPAMPEGDIQAALRESFRQSVPGWQIVMERLRSV